MARASFEMKLVPASNRGSGSNRMLPDVGGEENSELRDEDG